MGFDIIKISFWASFIVSTPACLYAVFFMGQNRDLYSIINSYGFSIGMVGMYFYPLLNIFSGKKFFDRLNEATFTWILFLSVLTAIVFQIPHNLFPVQLNSVKGTMFEWAFASYAKSDSRWNNYTATKEYGLAAEVWLINWNDSILALIVLFFFILFKVNKGNNKFKLFFILSVLFRDTTLFRETVEYMWDHHRKGYPFSTTELLYRNHAIACLWLVNITWLVAPLLSFVWAYYHISPIVGKNKKD